MNAPKILTLQMTMTEANALQEAAFKGGLVISTCRSCKGDSARMKRCKTCNGTGRDPEEGQFFVPLRWVLDRLGAEWRRVAEEGDDQ